MARLLALLVTAVALAFAAGCGGGESASPAPETVEGTLPAQPTETGGGTESGGGVTGDATAGKGVFASAGCGSCHTLSDAGATGNVGPNLDDSTIDEAAVVTQVTNGGGAMPPFGGSLSEQEIADVAAYVVSARSG